MPSPETFWERFPEQRSTVEQLLQWQRDRLPVPQLAAIHCLLLLGILLTIIALTAQPSIFQVLARQSTAYILKVMIFGGITEWLFMRLVLGGLVIRALLLVPAAIVLILIL